MQCSCGDYGAAAERQFTEEIAARDLKSFRAKGPGPTTRLLRDGLIQAGQTDGVVLDIGAGVGALTFELLAAGMTQAIAVDASPAYIEAASREAARRGCFALIRFVLDDFLNAAFRIPTASCVTLDRVICCYPVSRPLLEEAVRHAERHFAFSYPRDTWYVRGWNAVLNGKRRLIGNPFRTYIHSAAQMAQIVTGAGFRRVSRRGTFAWSVDVYARILALGQQSR
jgi:SAM-dependent methyltransferase